MWGNKVTDVRAKKPSRLVPGLRICTITLVEEISPYRRVKREDGTSKAEQAVWSCRCDCGETKAVAASSFYRYITAGRVPCKCQAPLRGNRTTHGMSQSPEYRSWSKMKERCANTKCNDYKDYGGRGISVCARWADSFENFYSDMGPRPTSKHSIDRVDVNGNYEPENCRWATQVEQANNKRTNVKVSLGTTELTVTEAAKLIGVSPKCLKSRLRRGLKGKYLLNPGRLKPGPRGA